MHSGCGEAVKLSPHSHISLLISQLKLTFMSLSTFITVMTNLARKLLPLAFSSVHLVIYVFIGTMYSVKVKC